MLASPDFKTTPQQIALLKYVVNQTLAGKADEIKDYTVAAAGRISTGVSTPSLAYRRADCGWR